MRIAGIVLAIIAKPLKGSGPIAGFRTLSDIARHVEPSQLPSIYARPWSEAESKISGTRRKTHRSWTAAEDETLSTLKARNMATHDIAEHLPGRSHAAISNRIHLLSISPAAQRAVRRTREEDDLLREAKASGLSFTQMLPSFPQRSRRALMFRWLNVVSVKSQGTNDSGRKAWTADELSRLRDMKQEKRTHPEIAERLGRSLASVASACRRAIPKAERKHPARVSKPYTIDEITVLKQLKAEGHRQGHIAKVLQRSPNSIKIAWQAIAAKEQIVRPPHAAWQPEEELQLLDAVGDNRELAEICTLFPHRTKAALKHRLNRLKKARQGRPSDSLPRHDS